MPEGVEVKLSAELIKPLVIGKVVSGMDVKGRYTNKWPEGASDFAKGSFNLFDSEPVPKILDVQTKGKFMYWTFANDWHLFCTFGMTGQWSPVKGKHPCLSLYLSDGRCGSEIHFNDPRHFGTIKFVKGDDLLSKKISELGWDPLQMSLSDNLPWLKMMIKKTNKTIAEVLMDQTIFSGVGNYIKSESLYKARISPWRFGKDLSDIDIEKLCQSVIEVMNESYQHQGATIQTYKTVYGEEGKYSSCFQVYGRKKDLLGNIVSAETTPDKRTTHWCPTIQI